MKRKLSALLVALLLAFTALATGCGGIATTKKLKLSDYAVPISEAVQDGIVKGVKARPEMNYLGTSYDLSGDNNVIYYNGSYYGLYNMDTESIVIDPSLGFTSLSAVSGFSGDLSGKAYVAESLAETEMPLESVYSSDGALLLEAGYYADIQGSSSVKYFNGIPLAAELTYSPADDSSAVKTVYLYENEDGYLRVASGNITSAPGVISSQVADARVYLPVAQSNIFSKWYSESDSFLNAYSVATETTDSYGINIYFKSGDKVTVLNLENDVINFMYVDGTILYSCIRNLPFDAEDGYDMIIKDSGNSMNEEKYEVKNYSFDIESGKTKEIKLQYVISESKPLFNRSLNKYDAVLITAVKKVDGVAIYENTINTVTFIIDKNGKVGYEFENMPAAMFDIIKLSDSRFLLSNNYIVDDKGEVVSKPGTVDKVGDSFLTVYNGSKYGAVDFDGKIVLPFVYENLDFSDGAAYTTVDSVGGDNNEKIVTVSNPGGSLPDTAFNLADGETIDYSSLNDFVLLGLIPTLKSFDDGAGTKGYTFTLYSFSGQSILNINIESSVSVNVIKSSNGQSLVNLSYYTPMNASYENEYYIIK